MFRKELQSFVSSSLSFKVLYSSFDQPLVSSMTERVLVLDSSFNPPHRAHMSLIKKAVTHNFAPKGSLTVGSVNRYSVLLLLSLRNADKKQDDLANYQHRLEMMRLLADHVTGELGVYCSIGLTDRSLFAQKQLVIEQGLDRPVPLTFLLGFDTLVRLLDPKYYSEGVKLALSGFFSSSNVLVVCRDGGSSYTVAQQQEYVDKIGTGRSAGIPKDWTAKIVLKQGDSSTLKVSSSEIRKEVAAGDSSWESSTFGDIAGYIKKEGLYK